MGVLPGIGPALTIALLLPITFNFEDPIGAFIMFAGIYHGAMYGGSTTSILLNTPGESASVATAIEGHLMARRGRARAALATAAIGSFVAGLISTVLLAFVAEPVGRLAATFQARSLSLAMVSVTALVGRSLVRGLLSLVLGLFIGLVGLDMLTGQARFTFGVPILADSVDITIVIVGLFAIGEVLHCANRVRDGHDVIAPLEKGPCMSKSDFERSWRPGLRGTAFGFPFGALRAGGAEAPTFLSYAYEKRRTRRKGVDEFGNGAIEGVAGPEAANNASFSGVLVPLLTLGLPTSATASVLLAAFQIFNLQPGPQLFQTSSTLVWALIAYGIGVLGFAMRRYDFPIAPAVLGVILGPMMEQQLRRSLVISDGDFLAVITRPLTLVILVLAAFALLLPDLPKISGGSGSRSARTTRLQSGRKPPRSTDASARRPASGGSPCAGSPRRGCGPAR